MDVRTAFFALLLVALAGVTALIIAPLLQYVLGAALLAFVLSPAYERLEPKIGARPAALSLTGFAVVAAIVPLLLVSLVVFETVMTFLSDVDSESVLEQGRDVAQNDLGLEADHVESLETALLSEVESSVSDAVELALGEVLNLVNTSIEMGLGLIVFVFLLYYMLLDGAAFVDWLRDVAPLEDRVQDELFEEVNVVTWAVIKSHVLVALVQGVLGGLGLFLLGIPNVAFWTVIMILVAFLPAIGVWLVWGPAVGYLWTTGDPVSAVALLLYGLAVLSVVDNYLRAIAVDHDSGLHPAVVLVGVIGGIYVLGIMGLFLGPVVLAVFKAGLDVFSKTSLAAAIETDAGDATAASPSSVSGSGLEAEPASTPQSDGPTPDD
ncbi:AI-2E family transporter [Halopiger djelfimassiliensis]|uniref:AI-2E family transporter n=1 Tax=Halopiger djelfimassiliensis TaxID=1293047 RepID=UPI0006781AA5|nr:AI-2E family transporter [Halopiger djelfimassiliensis]